VTGDACRLQWFVFDVRAALQGDVGVTLAAGNRTVRTVERKTARGVFEPRCRPRRGRVTASAVGSGIVVCKLAPVRVLVTRRTSGPNSEKGQLPAIGIRISRPMTLAAAHRGVLSLQRKASPAVIIRRPIPGIDRVTRLATSGGNQSVNLSPVRIPMTGLAACRGEDKREATIGRLVTRQTRYCLVGPSQRIVRLIVLGQQEPGRCIAVHGMALLACPLRRTSGKFPAMGVTVTVAASRKCKPPASLPGNMALGTRHDGVLSFQRIPGPTVIEIDRTDLAPTLRNMTRVAGRAEFPDVGVRMTVTALPVRKAGVPDVIHIRSLWLVGHRSMALGARHPLVSTGEWIRQGLVVESGRRRPRNLRMAFCTVGTHLSPVLVAVTAETARRKAEIGPTGIDFLVRRQRQTANELRCVALATGQGCMPPLKAESGQGVIEALLPIFPVNQIEITTLVFNMTKLALSVIRPTVQAASGLLLGLDPPVTDQALLRHQLTITPVTFRAVLDSFEKRVRPVQIAG